MKEKYTIPESDVQTIGESDVAYATPSTTLHLDITVEDNSIALMLQNVLKRIKGVSAVRIMSRSKEQASADPFAELDTSWGGDYDANIIAEELHAMRTDTRTIEPW